MGERIITQYWIFQFYLQDRYKEFINITYLKNTSIKYNNRDFYNNSTAIVKKDMLKVAYDVMISKKNDNDVHIVNEI